MTLSDGPSRHRERIQLVAVRIAEIGGIKAVFAHPGRAFVAAAIGKSDGMEAIHLVAILRADRRHGAVADRRRLAIIRQGDGYADAAARFAPPDRLAGIHPPYGAQLGRYRIVESGTPFEVVGADAHMHDHRILPILSGKSCQVPSLQSIAGSGCRRVRLASNPGEPVCVRITMLFRAALAASLALLIPAAANPQP